MNICLNDNQKILIKNSDVDFIEVSNLQKVYVLNDILMDLLDESIIDEFEFGKLLGAYCVCKGIALSTFDNSELGL